jgi:hypothetical protein
MMRLLLFPGLGADPGMYGDLMRRWRGPCPIVPLPWLPPGGSVAAYAARYAPFVRPDDLIGGSSFGGMVAIELVRRLGRDRVALIGSCDDPRHLGPTVRLLLPLAGTALVRMLVHRGMAGVVRFTAAAAYAQRSARCLARLARRTDPGVVAWAGQAIADWRPLPLDGVRIARIHGADDRIILPHGEACIVPHARHPLAISHPDAVAGFLMRFCA